MTCKKHGGVFYLRYKLFFVIVLGLAVAVGFYFSIQSVGAKLIDYYYMADSAVSDRLTEYEQSFESFVIDNDISVTDVSNISKWVKDQKNIYLILYDGDEIIYESGWWDEKSSAMYAEDSDSAEASESFEVSEGESKSDDETASTSEMSHNASVSIPEADVESQETSGEKSKNSSTDSESSKGYDAVAGNADRENSDSDNAGQEDSGRENVTAGQEDSGRENVTAGRENSDGDNIAQENSDREDADRGSSDSDTGRVGIGSNGVDSSSGAEEEGDYASDFISGSEEGGAANTPDQIISYVIESGLEIQKRILDEEVELKAIGETADMAAENAISASLALNQPVSTDSKNTDIDYEEDETGYSSAYSLTSVYYIPFSDGIFAASIIEFSELKWYELVRLLSWVAFILSLCLILLTYSSYVTKRIIKLSREVAVITQGTWDADISHQGNDEISQLAVDIDDLRIAMMEQFEREKAVWNVNGELITSMSHDIRTPLTALIGYLDILDSQDYRSEEEREKYIRSSRQKALQLKDLSDKLFQYFLVFGKDSIEMLEETYDAGILFQQIFGEQLFYLRNMEFNVITDFSKRGCRLTADIHYLKRLFDNLFSNVKKYAASGGDVLLKTRVVGSELLICIGNDIRSDDSLVESTNIGLKTCQKIVEQMRGRFSVSRMDSYFEVRIVLPVELYSEDEAQDEASSEAARPQ